MTEAMTISEYIRKIGELSQTNRHELIVECLEFFCVDGIKDLTLEQLAYYYDLIKQR